MTKRTQPKRPPAKATPLPRVQVRKVPAKPRKPFDWTSLLLALALAVVVGWVYEPSLWGQWLWDDDLLISQNLLIHDPDGIFNVWFNPSTLIDYFPLTVSVEWFIWQVWPNDPFPYHFLTIVLHFCGSLLVWRLLAKLGLRYAWWGGFLFAIHPIVVESVGWIAELKNTLSLPPSLLALCAWIDYDRNRKTGDYFLALGWFFAAMLCKTAMIMFPVVFLLYAWWRHDRIGWADLKRSIPFFGVGLALAVMLMLYLRHGVGEETIPLGGIFSRLACGGSSVAFYLYKSVLPLELLPTYPQWQVNPPSLWQFLPGPVLAGVLYGLWLKRATWGRHVLLGLGFFLINLVPFVGFHTISFMRFTWVMDHMLYLPIIGLISLAAAGLGVLDQRLGSAPRPYLIAAASIGLAGLAWVSHGYAGLYLNQETLWTYTIKLNPDSWIAHSDLGNALSDGGHLPEARAHYEEALRIRPDYPEAHNNLGIVLFQTGHTPEAIAEFQEALKYCPDLVSAQDNLRRVQSTVKK